MEELYCPCGEAGPGYRSVLACADLERVRDTDAASQISVVVGYGHVADRMQKGITKKDRER